MQIVWTTGWVEPGDKGMVTIIPLSVNILHYSQITHLGKVSHFMKFREEFPYFFVRALFCRQSLNFPLGVPSKKQTVYLKTLSKLRLTPSLLPYFWQIYFQHSVDQVDLPPLKSSGFETYILNYPSYFLRIRGTDRKTQSVYIILHLWCPQYINTNNNI